MPEPKYTKGRLRSVDYKIESDGSGLEIAATDNAPTVEEDHANAARLVDCWNACEGIEDPTAMRAEFDRLSRKRRADNWGPDPDSAASDGFEW